MTTETSSDERQTASAERAVNFVRYLTSAWRQHFHSIFLEPYGRKLWNLHRRKARLFLAQNTLYLKEVVKSVQLQEMCVG